MQETEREPRLGAEVPDHRFRRESKAAFMCECGASLCDQRVTMPAADYDGSLEPVFADGHGPHGGELGKCDVCGRPRQRARRRRR
jgi:hypothetical protein